MKESIKTNAARPSSRLDAETLRTEIKNFALPRYHEIPGVGLYLEQVTRYIAEILEPILGSCITNSMISNYVKKDMVASPHKKQYSREHIAYLIFIAASKSVMSLDSIKEFIHLEQSIYDIEEAYDYFCDELESTLASVFASEMGRGLATDAAPDDDEYSDIKHMLTSIVTALAHKIYLDKCLEALK